MSRFAAHHTFVIAGMTLAAALNQSCAQVIAAIPLAFCGTNTTAAQVTQLAEGPAIFVDAIRTIVGEVTGQSEAIGTGLQQGFNIQQQALSALGPYHYDGAGTYTRQAATDRSFRLRFFYGDNVAGKSPNTPLDADLANLSSYIKAPSFTDGLDLTTAQGPLFPLIQASTVSSGTLGFNDNALRLDLGSVLNTTLKGYGLSLALGTQRGTISNLVSQLSNKKLPLSLADTAMTNDSLGFALSLTQFDLTTGLDGTTSLGGTYGFSVRSGAIQYFGAVTTTSGSPVLSLRCSADAGSEFASVSFAGGSASVHFNAQNLPITLPGLAPYLPK